MQAWNQFALTYFKIKCYEDWVFFAPSTGHKNCLDKSLAYIKTSTTFHFVKLKFFLNHQHD